MIKRIPFMPFPLSTAKKMVKPFYMIGKRLLKLFPDLKLKLEQAEFDIEPATYLSLGLFLFTFWSLTIFSISFLFSLFTQLPNDFMLMMALVSLVIGSISFFYIMFYPKLLIAKRVKNLDKNLLFALRHLLIQVKSGVPLYDGMVSVSRGDYGLVSDEFRKCTKKISTGTSETSALEELTFKNPSLYFRRTIWQIANAFRSGADLGRTLDNIVNNLMDEQKIQIRKYGSQLNPLAMMYMMVAVIIPSLGISFLIILSSFSGIPITETIFWLILGASCVFQFSFIGIIKSRRPAVEL